MPSTLQIASLVACYTLTKSLVNGANNVGIYQAPHIQSIRESKGGKNLPALVIMDNFKGQVTDNVKALQSSSAF